MKFSIYLMWLDVDGKVFYTAYVPALLLTGVQLPTCQSYSTNRSGDHNDHRVLSVLSARSAIEWLIFISIDSIFIRVYGLYGRDWRILVGTSLTLLVALPLDIVSGSSKRGILFLIARSWFFVDKRIKSLCSKEIVS